MPDLINQTKLICKTYNLFPSRQKGQHFLINEDFIEKIIAAADLKVNDAVLEVGPGLGILTEALIKKAKQVISVELDQKLFNFLKVKFTGTSNLELVNQDILKFNPATYKLSPPRRDLTAFCGTPPEAVAAFHKKYVAGKANSYQIVANLPYNITSHFLRKFLTMENRPSAMTILVQKEVAQRICAQKGEMSLLSISVQFYGEPKIIDYVGKNNFWPKPEVDSAILKISEIRNQKSIDKFFGQEASEKNFWRLIHVGFSAKRKQLQNNLAAGLKIDRQKMKETLVSLKLDPLVRAEALSIKDWLALAKKLNFYLN